MRSLKGQVAIVAGGSRGAGRGIALALGEAGATIYVAARTSRAHPKPTPGTVEDTAEEVAARGGTAIAVQADLSKEPQVAALVERVMAEQGRLDILANSAWGANFMPVWNKRFWELGSEIWQETQDTISVCWLTSVYAARIMTTKKRGLIVHITDNPPGEDPSGYRGQILHDLGHESLNRLIAAMSTQTAKEKVTVVGMNPGFMRTEGVWMHMINEARMRQFRFDLSESPEYVGRAIAALAADPKMNRKNGRLLWAAELAKEYGFTDVDGRVIPLFDLKTPLGTFPVPSAREQAWQQAGRKSHRAASQCC
jgi:NAD(P)-dependent dehydrogenase (short-subunit alcohol dehydrogenase family)